MKKFPKFSLIWKRFFFKILEKNKNNGFLDVFKILEKSVFIDKFTTCALEPTETLQTPQNDCKPV